MVLAGGQWGTPEPPEPFPTATACRRWDSPCLGHHTDFLSLGYKEDAFTHFPRTSKLFSFHMTHDMANGFTPPSIHRLGCPPGAMWVFFQAGVSTRGVSETLRLPGLPCRQDLANTVVTKCLQHGRQKTCCFPAEGLLWLMLLHTSRHLLCSTAGLSVTRTRFYCLCIFY